MEIQIGNLPSGTYLIRLMTANTVVRRRFIKE